LRLTGNANWRCYLSMKLLFDQNLSPRLSRLLADIYPASVHVREVGLRDADDILIWEYAKAHGFALVSKDSDFQQRSLLIGAPPKFIWLRVGNCTVATTEILLRRHSAAIHTFDLDQIKSHLILP
jgi:predicted nuclease of predicted toxin-antitoxin system